MLLWLIWMKPQTNTIKVIKRSVNYQISLNTTDRNESASFWCWIVCEGSIFLNQICGQRCHLINNLIQQRTIDVFIPVTISNSRERKCANSVFCVSLQTISKTEEFNGDPVFPKYAPFENVQVKPAHLTGAAAQTPPTWQLGNSQPSLASQDLN